MKDKVQKIREEVERLMNEPIQEKEKGFGSDVDDACILELLNVLTYIDSLQEEPVSEDFNKALEDKIRKAQGWTYIEEMGCECPIYQEFGAYDLEKFAKWAANWQKQQFKKNRLKHCNSITNEQAELEQGFIDQHFDKYNCIPTFLDAIEYGMRLQKEQLMAKAEHG